MKIYGMVWRSLIARRCVEMTHLDEGQMLRLFHAHEWVQHNSVVEVVGHVTHDDRIELMAT